MPADPQRMRILVDGHGGDHAPRVVVQALRHVLDSAGADLQLGIVGRPEELAPALEKQHLANRVAIVPASQVVGMDDSPAGALRGKKDSSMHVGARAVREGNWDAFVSAGNTGALMAIAKFILKTLPGVDRPAIASMIPAIGGKTLLLDSGANVDCTSDHLVQFAAMGACYMQAAEGLEAPRVGLLNIGTEDIKGTDVIKVAAAKLRQSPLNFIGNVEGTDIFRNSVDVVVCDGFVGNVALKSMEGAANLIIHHLKRELSGNVLAKVSTLLAKGALKRFQAAIHPSEYNGAPLLGLNGIIVKSHGSADSYGFANAIAVARREVAAGLGRRITELMNSMALLP